MRVGYQSLPDRPWTLLIRDGWLNPGAAPSQGPPAPERSPAMTGLVTPVTRSVISSPDAQAAIWFLGALSQVRLSGEQTAGAFSLTDNLNRRGNGSPVHVHDREDETIFVLDGDLRVIVGEEDYAAGPGTVALLPRRLRRHLRHRAVPHPAHPGRLRAVRRRGRRAGPGAHPAPARRGTAGPGCPGRGDRPAPYHHPGPATPALDPARLPTRWVHSQA